jgi:hypothetical protein
MLKPIANAKAPASILFRFFTRVSPYAAGPELRQSRLLPALHREGRINRAAGSVSIWTGNLRFFDYRAEPWQTRLQIISN